MVLKERQWLTVALWAVFAVLAAVRVAAIFDRHELHSDEIYSLMLAQANAHYTKPLPADTVLTGADARAMLVSSHSLEHDLQQLYVNNNDIPHASLYYMALRVALCGIDSFSAEELAVRGGLLNMLFWAVAYVALWRLSQLLFGQRRYGGIVCLATLAIAYGIPMSVRNTLLVREYQMAAMFIVLLAWASAVLSRRLMSGRRPDFRQWAMYGLAAAGALSTGYLNAFFVILTAGAVAVTGLLHSRRETLWQAAAACSIALLVSWAMYAGYFNFLLHQTVHTVRAFESFDSVFGVVFGQALMRGGLGLFGTILFGIIALWAIAGPGRRELVAEHNQWWLSTAALLTMLTVEYCAVLHHERYTYPFEPVFVLVFPTVVCALPDKWLQAVSVFFGVYILVTCVVRPVRTYHGWAYMRGKLEHGAILYRLHANELPQIAPAMADTVGYRLVSNDSALAVALSAACDSDTLPIVANTAPTLPTEPAPSALTGPLKLYKAAK